MKQLFIQTLSFHCKCENYFAPIMNIPMNKPNIYLNKSLFVRSKTNPITDDYEIGKVELLLYAVIRQRSLWDSVPREAQSL